jgi:hypothetical protein
MSNRSKYRKHLVSKLLLAIFSIIVTLFMAEGLLRTYWPSSTFSMGSELQSMRNNPYDLKNLFTIDPDFGFRPILGNNFYNEYGTRINGYRLEKKQDITRLLFIGDSVTYREKIVDKLKRLFGEEKFEYWNAGVESFNTVQEVNYYKKYNCSINPDHVILTFHLNDFETTPISFYQDDRIVVYAPNMSMDYINPWLFKNSDVYRLISGLRLNRGKDGRETIIREVHASLADLRDVLSADNIKLTVLILPYLTPPAKWSPDQRQGRQRIIDILEILDIKYFDLFDILEQATRGKVNVQQIKGDIWHPSDEISVMFGKYLYAERIFQPVSDMPPHD